MPGKWLVKAQLGPRVGCSPMSNLPGTPAALRAAERRTDMKRWAATAILLGGLGAARADDGLPMTVVDQVVDQNDRAVQACGRALARRGDETVAILVALTVDERGRVSDAAATTRSRAGTCLERVARALVFPAPGAVHHLTFPFMLVPRR
jgi:hypothetical protein